MSFLRSKNPNRIGAIPKTTVPRINCRSKKELFCGVDRQPMIATTRLTSQAYSQGRGWGRSRRRRLTTVRPNIPVMPGSRRNSMRSPSKISRNKENRSRPLLMELQKGGSLNLDHHKILSGLKLHYLNQKIQ